MGRGRDAAGSGPGPAPFDELFTRTVLRYVEQHAGAEAARVALTLSANSSPAAGNAPATDPSTLLRAALQVTREPDLARSVGELLAAALVQAPPAEGAASKPCAAGSSSGRAVHGGPPSVALSAALQRTVRATGSVVDQLTFRKGAVGVRTRRNPGKPHDRLLCRTVQAALGQVSGGIERVDATCDHASTLGTCAYTLRWQARQEAERAESRERVARALVTIASELVQAQTVESAARCLADAVPHATGLSRCAVWLWSPDDAAFVSVSTSGLTPDEAASLAARALLRDSLPDEHTYPLDGSPYVLSEDQIPASVVPLCGQSSRTVWMAPLVRKGDLLGLIGAAPADGELEIDAELAHDTLRGIADQAAVAVHSARLLEQVTYQALHDGLTGLPNRRMLADRLDRTLAEHRVQKGRTALLFIDIDRFKAVNDTYGHAFGDALLRVVAARVFRLVRASDMVARLGGDEFVVLLHHIDLEHDARRIGQKILDSFREPIHIGGRSITVSVSIGLAFAEAGKDTEALRAELAGFDARPEQLAAIAEPPIAATALTPPPAPDAERQRTAEMLLQGADNAMYQAKSAGRNCLRTA